GDWSRQMFASIGKDFEGGRRRWSKMQGALNQISLPGVDATDAVKDAGKLEFDVTRCSYAEFFKALNEPELGALLMCSTYFDIAATSDGEVTLTRQQTIMRRAAPSATGSHGANRRLFAGSAPLQWRSSHDHERHWSGALPAMSKTKIIQWLPPPPSPPPPSLPPPPSPPPWPPPSEWPPW